MQGISAIFCDKGEHVNQPTSIDDRGVKGERELGEICEDRKYIFFKEN